MCKVKARVREICRQQHGNPRKPERHNRGANDKLPAKGNAREVEQGNNKKDKTCDAEQVSLAWRAYRQCRVPAIVREEQNQRHVKYNNRHNRCCAPGNPKNSERKESRGAKPDDAGKVGDEKSNTNFGNLTKYVVMHKTFGYLLTVLV